jgi:hypothetical protein
VDNINYCCINGKLYYDVEGSSFIVDILKDFTFQELSNPLQKNTPLSPLNIIYDENEIGYIFVNYQGLQHTGSYSLAQLRTMMGIFLTYSIFTGDTPQVLELEQLSYNSVTGEGIYIDEGAVNNVIDGFNISLRNGCSNNTLLKTSNLVMNEFSEFNIISDSENVFLGKYSTFNNILSNNVSLGNNTSYNIIDYTFSNITGLQLSGSKFFTGYIKIPHAHTDITIGDNSSYNSLINVSFVKLGGNNLSNKIVGQILLIDNTFYVSSRSPFVLPANANFMCFDDINDECEYASISEKEGTISIPLSKLKSYLPVFFEI